MTLSSSVFVAHFCVKCFFQPICTNNAYFGEKIKDIKIVSSDSWVEMNFAVPLSELCVKSHPSFKMAAIAKMKQIVKNKNKRLKIFYKI